MKTLKLIAVLALAGLVSACADARIASRNAPFEPVSPGAFASGVPSVSVQDIRVRVPKRLRVSEANSYYPSGDIVWRGDPLGDRYQQVAQVMYDGLRKGANDLTGATAVDLDIEVLRFHGLTEKARYSTGGVHNITFAMQIRDAETGALIAEPRIIEADLRAYGGLEAIAADGRGETQKVRIVNHLAEVVQNELTTAEGHQNAKLGVFQQLNRL